MKFGTKAILFIISSLILTGEISAQQSESAADVLTPAAKIILFNGKDLDGWFPYTPDKEADPAELFLVRDGVISCAGNPRGYLRTTRAYANYRLHVEWRWVINRNDKRGHRRNSGVLLHMSEPDKVWPKSIECQLMSRNAADFWVIGGTDFNEHKAVVREAVKAAGDNAKKIAKAKRGRRTPKMGESTENPLGKWNEYDIICTEDSILPHVNGELKNRATGISVSSGMICLQSEGAPIEFRNIYIEPLEE